MAVSLSWRGDAITPGTPTRLFTTAIHAGGEGGYAVARDGRFLVNVPTAGTTQTPISIFLDWGSSVRER